MKLSLRLEALLEMAGSCRCLADIGTDHGFIPLEAVRRGRAGRAVASDVGEGPLERAREHIEKAGLQERIDCRLGSGLETLLPGEADVILIAGMGGPLMAGILRDGHRVLKETGVLVLSPHTEADEVRRELQSQGFLIEDEAMIRDADKYYPIIRAVRAAGRKLSEEELLYGPVLLKKRPEIFLEFLKKEYEKSRDLAERLKGASEGSASWEAGKRAQERTEMLKKLLYSEI